MTVLTRLETYQDERGNRIETDLKIDGLRIVFTGSNNRLIVKAGAKIKDLGFLFECNNGYCEIGNNSFQGMIRIGEDGRVIIGDGVTCTAKCYISTAEGAEVIIGNDCMIASGNEIRADDGHPIFDVTTEKRINMPRSILIGNHVWLAAFAVVLGGSTIGDGTVIGYRSLVKGKIPNNCIAAGVPARVMKKNIAWERPHLTLSKPYYKRDAQSVKKSEFWNLTVEEEPKKTGASFRRFFSWLNSAL